MWIMVLVISLFIISLASILYAFLRIPPIVKHTIIICDDVDIRGLNEKITKVYLTYSPINKLTSILPITHEISHWMVIIETVNNYTYIISTSSNQCVEIINSHYNKYMNHIIYNYHGQEYYYKVYKSFDVKDVNINVLKYCEEILKHYKQNGKYTLFNNNCHNMTEYGIINVLKINEAQELLKRSYKPGHLIKEVITNNEIF